MIFPRPCTVALCRTPASHILVEPRSNLYFCDEHWPISFTVRDWWLNR